MKITHQDITCKELFEAMHEKTSIPIRMMRITLGSRELYPSDRMLSRNGELELVLTMKLRLCGGVRDT